MNDDDDLVRAKWFDRLMGAAVVVFVWSVVICAVLSMGRCTYDLVAGNKVWDDRASRDGGDVFRPR